MSYLICLNPECGKEFVKVRSTNVYCSKYCYNYCNMIRKRKAKAIYNCIICGKEYDGRSDKKTCSKKCQRKLYRIRNPSIHKEFEKRKRKSERGILTIKRVQQNRIKNITESYIKELCKAEGLIYSPELAEQKRLIIKIKRKINETTKYLKSL